jgi:hypothetical protein
MEGKALLQQLRHQLGSQASVTHEDDAGWIAITPSGQRLSARVGRGREIDWLVVSATVCRVHEMDALQALERGAQLAFATFVVWDDEFWLRVEIPLDSREVGDVGEAARLCLAAARSLSPVHAQAATALEASRLYDHYT